MSAGLPKTALLPRNPHSICMQ
uniref:Uncharacterized protein n=1 Tax=Anguilla anguilla TaxID=7936 RepID=A0A0E9PH59_ANGAN